MRTILTTPFSLRMGFRSSHKIRAITFLFSVLRGVEIVQDLLVETQHTNLEGLNNTFYRSVDTDHKDCEKVCTFLYV